MSSILERRAPCDLDAESAVIGSVMIKPDVFPDVMAVVRESMFFDDAHRKLYGALLGMYEDGKAIDVTLLVDRLNAAGDYEAVGGAQFLAKIANSVPSAAHAVYYSEIIRGHYIRRCVIEACTEGLQKAYDETEAITTVLSEIDTAMMRTTEESVSSEAPIALHDALHETMDLLERRLNGDVQVGFQTGYTDADEMFTPRRGELTIIGGRPSMGKSAYLLNCCDNILRRSPDTNMIIFSLEMGETDMIERVLCSRCNINIHHLRNGTINQEQRLRIVEAAGMMASGRLWIKDDAIQRVHEMQAHARTIKRRSGCDIIFIDYLQLITPADHRDSREQQVSRIARELKAMAKQLDAAVIAACQLNRAVEDGRDNRPKLSHLRESGAIEQDADVVCFTHRPFYYTRDEADRGEAQLIVAKNRNGPTGDVELVFHEHTATFANRAPERFDDFDDYNTSGRNDGF